MDAMDFRDRWVLITGASSGLGRDMARLFAREHQANLILVARRGQRLRDLAIELEAEANVQVRVVEADLSREADVDRVFAESRSIGQVYGVVLNAGVTHFGKHADLSWDGFRAMLATNVTSVVRLTSLFVPYLADTRQRGGIMIVGSLAGLTPIPYQSAYSGTKAFLAHFARALSEELTGSDVSLTLFEPGGIATELSDNAGLSQYFDSSLAMMASEVCARRAIAGFKSRKRSHVPGLLNKVSLALTRMVPECLATRVVGSAYRRALASLPANVPSSNP